MLPEKVVVHASALVELLVGTENASWVHGRLRGCRPHAPAQVDAEVMACLDRLTATAGLPPKIADDAVRRLVAMPLVRHPLAELVPTAWATRSASGTGAALYVALAERLGAPLVTTDARMAPESRSVEVVGRGTNQWSPPL